MVRAEKKTRPDHVLLEVYSWQGTKDMGYLSHVHTGLCPDAHRTAYIGAKVRETRKRRIPMQQKPLETDFGGIPDAKG